MPQITMSMKKIKCIDHLSNLNKLQKGQKLIGDQIQAMFTLALQLIPHKTLSLTNLRLK
jgi:hypothetical protein